MYVPASFRIDDREILLDFADRHAFATVVSVLDGVPFASHIPLVLDRSANVLLGHMARANPQWKHFGTDQEILAIFTGPHAYVSPTWYVDRPAVPTWNYATVHVYGVPRLISPERTADAVDTLVTKYEDHRETPWPNKLPDDFRRRMLAAIVGFEIPIARIEGKFKLGQNRSAVDQAGMLQGLRNDGPDAVALADFIDRNRHEG